MFEKKVIIKDDLLIIGRNRILWDQIVGLKEQSGSLFKKIAYRFPRAEIFLNGGKVVTISNVNKILNQSSFPIKYDKNIFELIMELIRKKATHLNPDLENHIQWRAILPIVVVEMIAFIISIIQGNTFEDIVLIVIFAGILSAAIGWIWERQKRKKFCRLGEN
jgi:hypothetical protein